MNKLTDRNVLGEGAEEMDKAAWIAFAALLVTIFTVTGGGLWALFSRMESNRISAQTDLGLLRDSIHEEFKAYKNTFDGELEEIRSSAYLEYKALRDEYQARIDKAYRELGEAPQALRVKIGEVEMWMRDHLLPRKEYERDQGRLNTLISGLADAAIKRLDSIERKMDEEKNERLKAFQAQRGL
jgi:hypothetical protein